MPGTRSVREGSSSAPTTTAGGSTASSLNGRPLWTASSSLDNARGPRNIVRTEGGGVANEMKPSDSIYVAGHRGLAGGAIFRALKRQGFTNLVTRTHAELDLTHAGAVDAFFQETRPRFV